MNEFDYNLLWEKAWRHRLSDAEIASVRAWLAQHPESRADWELEAGLSVALGKLPDVPVPSNFTARVLQAVERETAVAQRPVRGFRWFWRSLVPRMALVAVVLGVGGLAYHQRATSRRVALVRDVKVVAGVASLPSPEILQDFDTIRRMSSTPGPDPELIALMK